MKVNVNSKEIELDKSMTIAEIIIKLGIKSVGIAVALNYEIVSKKDYDKTKVKDGDKIEIIQAVQGG